MGRVKGRGAGLGVHTPSLSLDQHPLRGAPLPHKDKEKPCALHPLCLARPSSGGPAPHTEGLSGAGGHLRWAAGRLQWSQKCPGAFLGGPRPRRASAPPRQRWHGGAGGRRPLAEVTLSPNAVRRRVRPAEGTPLTPSTPPCPLPWAQIRAPGSAGVRVPRARTPHPCLLRGWGARAAVGVQTPALPCQLPPRKASAF